MKRWPICVMVILFFILSGCESVPIFTEFQEKLEELAEKHDTPKSQAASSSDTAGCESIPVINEPQESNDRLAKILDTKDFRIPAFSITDIDKSISDLFAPESFEKAYAYRTDKPDALIQKLLKDKSLDAKRKSKPTEYVQEICKQINENAANDFEKVKMLHDVVTLLLTYDANSYWKNSIPDQNWTSVLSTKYSVCAGYANLFFQFCSAAEVECLIIHGYARGVGTSLHNEIISSNHAWNAVKIDGFYYLIDCTWDSGYMDGKTAKRKYTTDWLFLKPEQYIYTHLPDDVRYEFLPAPMTEEQFLQLPDFRPKYFAVAGSPLVSKKTTIVNDIYSYSVTVNPAFVLNFNIVNIETKKKVENCVFQNYVQNGSVEESMQAEVSIALPVAGEYEVTIFYRERGTRTGWSCGSFILQSEAGSSIKYPTVLVDDLAIISPTIMPLIMGETYHFEYFVPDMSEVVFIAGKQFIEFLQTENGSFAADITIPKGNKKIKIGTRKGLKEAYTIIAEYEAL